jgi:hypothetical protein
MRSASMPVAFEDGDMRKLVAEHFFKKCGRPLKETPVQPHNPAARHASSEGGPQPLAKLNLYTVDDLRNVPLHPQRRDVAAKKPFAEIRSIHRALPYHDMLGILDPLGIRSPTRQR